MARVVVIGWGNEARGDDAAGPTVVRRLAAAALPSVTVIEAYQLQIEHALDLADADLVLFIDAERDGPGPVLIRRVTAKDQRAAPFSHALSPETLLAVYRAVTGAHPPEAYVIGVPGLCFDLGAPMTPSVAAATEEAGRLAAALCAHPDAEVWRAMAAGRDVD